MAEMTQGSLQIADVVDYVDIETETAWLRFTCNGQTVHIDCEVNSDWVDPSIFGHFVDLLAKNDPNKLFIYYDLGGQDCIIGCATQAEFQQLKQIIPKVEALT